MVWRGSGHVKCSVPLPVLWMWRSPSCWINPKYRLKISKPKVTSGSKFYNKKKKTFLANRHTFFSIIAMLHVKSFNAAEFSLTIVVCSLMVISIDPLTISMVFWTIFIILQVFLGTLIFFSFLKIRLFNFHTNFRFWAWLWLKSFINPTLKSLFTFSLITCCLSGVNLLFFC